ncbi:MAG TPA: ABC transporter permease [Spirochaetia bacterium]|nr:ABC transporter permease [Spirochaetia bacterium]
MSDKPLSNTLPPQDRVEPQDASPVGEDEQVQDLNRLRNKGKGVSLWQDAWRRLKKNKMAMIGMVVVGLYAIISLSAPILPIYSFRFQILEHQYLPPSLTKTAGELVVEQQTAQFLQMNESMGGEGLTEAQEAELTELRERMATETAVIDGEEILVHSRRYILGTDNLGRDMLSRIIYGGQISILIGLIGTVVSVFLGTAIGALSGYVGGRLDSFLMRLVDILYGLPYMLLVIIFMAVLGRSIANLFFALAIVSWLTVARVVRGQIMSLKASEFVEAARASGASPFRVIFRHLVPNTLGVIVVYTTLRIPSFIMLEAFLSFLGLGVQAPLSSWGSLVGGGVDAMIPYPWLLFAPAIVMTVFLFSMNFLGDGLRDALDVQSKNKM